METKTFTATHDMVFQATISLKAGECVNLAWPPYIKPIPEQYTIEVDKCTKLKAAWEKFSREPFFLQNTAMVEYARRCGLDVDEELHQKHFQAAQHKCPKKIPHRSGVK